jgi:hypothetical protein
MNVLFTLVIASNKQTLNNVTAAKGGLKNSGDEQGRVRLSQRKTWASTRLGSCSLKGIITPVDLRNLTMACDTNTWKPPLPDAAS